MVMKPSGNSKDLSNKLQVNSLQNSDLGTIYHQNQNRDSYTADDFASIRRLTYQKEQSRDSMRT